VILSPDRDLAGFVVKAGDRERLELAVDGIDCAACMPEIEEAVGALPGVLAARVNLTERRLAVEWREGEADTAPVLAALARLGYRAEPFDPARRDAAEAVEARRLLRCLAVASFAAMNVMMLSVSVWSGNASDLSSEQRDLFHWLSALIALPAGAYAGRPFFESAWRALSRGGLNMDVPISLGVVLALALSLGETMTSGRHAYFDSAMMLLAFLLAGRFLDQNMRRRTRDVALHLAALRADSAFKLLPGGGVLEVPLSRVDPGDRVLVRAGDRVPVDGRVVEGRAELDRSLVTGETTPEPVEVGAAVQAGALNLSGVLTVQATAATADSFLERVGRLIEAAAQSRSRYVRLADRASRLYAPVVHAAALATFAGWMLAGAGWHSALVTAIAVLIITCPCALGLAVPAVQTVASQALFRAGVLLHSGDAIERLAEADTVVFDKTGTLTLPEARVEAFGAPTPDDEHAAAALATASRHPLAAALRRALPEASPPPLVEETRGEGVSAVIGGEACFLGRPGACGAEALAGEAAAALPGASLVAFRRGDAPPVVFAVRQGLRPGAREAVARLVAAGLKVEILSGDRPEIVAATAAELGVATFAGGLAPQDKIARLEALAAAGRKTLMVGDGLNDAPALQAAHVSLAPASAAQLSQAAADAVFLGERLAPVPEAIEIARRARRLMSENLWLSVVYNLIAVPIAVAGWATPLVAALAMSGSSDLVTLNALRARRGARP
jgi:Cu2+-exporting ATPase